MKKRSFIFIFLICPLISFGQESNLNLEKADFYRNLLGPTGIEVELDKDNGLAYATTKSGRRLFAIPITKDKATLNDFSPRNIGKTLALAAKRTAIAAPFLGYKATQLTYNSFKHSLIHFPVEAVKFYLVVGAVTAQELATSYKDSPLAIEDFLHELSPAGLFGFYLFISGSRFTQNLLHQAWKNPTFHRHAVPYLGLAAGSLLQTISSNILFHPNFDGCMNQIMPRFPKRRNMFTGTSLQSLTSPSVDAAADPCQQLFHDTANAEYLKPTISLLLGSAISTGVQITAAVATQKVPILSHLTVAVKNGLPFLKTQWWASGVQLVVFLKTLSFIEEPFNYWWDTDDLEDPLTEINDKLVKEIVKSKNYNWQSTQGLSATSDEFEELFAKWNLANTNAFMTKFDSWRRMLEKVTNFHRVMTDFYANFVNSTQTIGTNNNLFAVKNPFHGVFPQNMSQEQFYNLYEKPSSFFELQSKMVRDAGLRLANIALKEKLRASDLEHLNKVQQLLISNDYLTQSRGLTLMIENKRVKLNHIFQDLLETLGSPAPRLEYGSNLVSTIKYSYLHPELSGNAYDFFMQVAAENKNKKVTLIPLIGEFEFENSNQFEDYFIFSMICGAQLDQGQNTISTNKNKSGYQLFSKYIKGLGYHFQPPQITNPDDEVYYLKQENNAPPRKMRLCHLANQSLLTYKDLYESKIYVNNRVYSNAIEYIVNNISFRNIKEFYKWWEATVDRELEYVLKKEGAEFAKLTNELIEKLRRRKDSGWNDSPLANGVIWQLKQKLRLHLLILGELFVDKYHQQYKKDVPAELLTQVTKPIPDVQFHNSVSKVNSSQTPPLLRLLQSTNILSFNELMYPYEFNPEINYKKNQRADVSGHKLKALAQVENSLDYYFGLFYKDTITTKDIKQATNLVFGGIENLLTLYRGSEKNTEPLPHSVLLNKAEDELASKSIYGILEVSNLLGNYARMIYLADAHFLAELDTQGTGSTEDIQNKIDAAKKKSGYKRPGQN